MFCAFVNEGNLFDMNSGLGDNFRHKRHYFSKILHKLKPGGAMGKHRHSFPVLFVVFCCILGLLGCDYCYNSNFSF